MTKMRTISEYKDMALESLSDNWGQGALVTFVYLLTYCGIILVHPTNRVILSLCKLKSLNLK